MSGYRWAPLFAAPTLAPPGGSHGRDGGEEDSSSLQEGQQGGVNVKVTENDKYRWSSVYDSQPTVLHGYVTIFRKLIRKCCFIIRMFAQLVRGWNRQLRCYIFAIRGRWLFFTFPSCTPYVWLCYISFLHMVFIMAPKRESVLDYITTV